MAYWESKVALVTGGSGGLGLAIASELVRLRARVAIVARGSEQLSRAARELGALGGDVLPIQADVTSDAEVARMIEEVIARFGRLDLLVNNVGRSARGELLATTPAEFRELLELNLIATVRVTRAAAPHLVAARGQVVNIGSLAAKSATRFMGAYPASKFALAAYTQQLRLELAEHGVGVLLACPGPIAREQERHYVAEDSSLPASARKPGAGVKVKQLAPDHVARAILQAAERRAPELVVPGKARWLFAIAQLSPRLGDWIVRRMT